MNRTRITLAALAALASITAYHAFTGPPPNESPPRMRFTDGIALRYAITHRSTQRVRIPELGAGDDAPTLTAAAHLEGDLVLTGLPPGPDTQRFTLRFENLSTARLTVQGQSLLAAPLDAPGAEAIVAMRPDGEVTAIRLPADAPQALHVAVHLVLTETQIRLGDGIEWHAIERTAHGETRGHYRRSPDGITRTRDTYALQAIRAEVKTSVDSRARFALRDGRITHLVADEAIEAHAIDGGPRLLTARSHTTLTLRAVERAAARPLPPLAAATPLGAPAAAADPEAQIRRQRIGDLTAAEARHMLEGAAGGRLPEHNRSLWRLTALLRQDPKLAAWLGDFASAPGRTRPARALALDLLTSAGTPAAQRALRAALDSEAMRATDGYAVLYQRAALLKRPDGDTLDWMTARHARPGPEGQTAATLALGAVAGAAARHDAQGERGRALADGLLDEALTADDTLTRSTRLRALGNAARPEHAAAIAAFAHAEDTHVRHAAAAALRRIDGPEAHAALVELAVDEDARVQGRALTSLGERPLSADDMHRLAAAIADGTLAESSLDRAVDRVMANPHEPAGQAVLDAILARDLRDDRVKGRVRAMRGG